MSGREDPGRHHGDTPQRPNFMMHCVSSEAVVPGGADAGEDPGSLEYAKSQEHLLRQSDHNPLPTEVPPPIAALGGNHGDMHVVVLIGLPEVGKPFLAKRMRQYLRFFHGADCRLFDICEHLTPESEGVAKDVDDNAEVLTQTITRWILKREAREISSGDVMQSERIVVGSGVPPAVAADGDHADESFRSQNRGQKVVDSGRCAIVYGSDTFRAFKEKWSGSSKERRRWILESVRRMSRQVKLIFIEVKVTDPALMRKNIALKRSAHGHPQTSSEEFRQVEASIRDFSRMYVTIQDDGSEDDMSYVIFINYGQKVVTNRMHGFLRMRIAQFLSTIHTEPHTIYITRHGQSEYNRLGKIGGNSGLTEYGAEYAERLAQFAEQVICMEDGERVNKARLWTSSLRRTNETAEKIKHPTVEFEDGEWMQMSHRVYRNLDEIFAGEYEGLTYEEVAERHQDEAFLRKVDKIGYRYPRGESYFDIISRLDPLVHELESYREPTLIVSHQAVLRILYAYLMGYDRMHAPRIEIPLHTVIKLSYNGWSRCVEERVHLGPEVPKTIQ
mmetsp:Transcript_7714/g.22536  ORF Transcript_7714/g.22536 Transcript_7714/m.22536 type:complete len:558 (+) Transcript_7714:24-1697(+)